MFTNLKNVCDTVIILPRKFSNEKYADIHILFMYSARAMPTDRENKFNDVLDKMTISFRTVSLMQLDEVPAHFLRNWLH